MKSNLKLGKVTYGTEKKEEVIQKALAPYFQQVTIKTVKTS